MNPQIQLGSHRIGRDTGPYVIAEIGVNHEGSLDTARRLIELAHQGGAHAAKFQTYKAEKIASRHSPAYWDLSKEPTTSQFQLFKKHDTFGDAEYLALAEHCRKVGIDFLSTPFDAEAVDFLDPLMPFFKIASADLTNVPMLRQIARKGKPVVLSTGASTLGEIDMAVEELRRAGAPAISLLHCVLNYPTPYASAHIGMIDGLMRAYPELVIGYSDHTLPDPAMAVLTAAVVKGARIIEKHFTHDKSLPGNDHYHAMDVEDLSRFTANLALLAQVEGSHHKAPLDSEAPARANARRSIVLARALRAGETVTEESITYKRPAHGVSPLHWDQVIGMTARIDLEEDHVLQWTDVLPNKEL
ncbi:acetylneuraminic acid synthetase [Magnetospirillum sp. ME-1]|uniref:N-acetylneuraminate synthase family protein n=1 Tax=Magnetospirillum sp. ME-1 TaxID=1639348 RepID=UPI000A17E57D|nr:N-acetylneuraminate synthase family protein [Magnetospirillum sp. ME-1]ARJ66549.1 acetylneuraminic acid synthetase [Magnetospirillum sp. ME-1]